MKSDHEIQIFDVASGAAVRELRVDEGYVAALDFSADARLLACRTTSETVLVFDLAAAGPPLPRAK